MMENDNKAFKDLPAHLKNSYRLYKIHGAVVDDFIRAHGGKIKSTRDWDSVPYLVRERLRGKRPPDEIKESLDIVIKNRILLADEFEARRKAARKKLAPIDLSHLIFIDKLRNVQRAWFSDDISTKASNKRHNTGVRKQQPTSPLTSGWADFASSNGNPPMSSTSEPSQTTSKGSQQAPSQDAREKNQENESRAWGGIDQVALVGSRLILLFGYGLIIAGSLILILIVRSLMWLRQTLCMARRHLVPSSSRSTPSGDL